MKTYALITDEGTAASETALCENHFNAIGRKEALRQAYNDAKEPFKDVSGNDACKCIICGL